VSAVPQLRIDREHIQSSEAFYPQGAEEADLCRGIKAPAELADRECGISSVAQRSVVAKGEAK